MNLPKAKSEAQHFTSFPVKQDLAPFQFDGIHITHSPMRKDSIL